MRLAREGVFVKFRTATFTPRAMAIRELLDSAALTSDFREGLIQFLADHRPNDAVRFGPGSPPVKVQRALTHLLSAHPEWEIEGVELTARSGCEYYRGDLLVETPLGHRTVHFEWNCRWKAEQMGWSDAFGFPDQIRAAREFDHDCFRRWEVSGSGEGAALQGV
jgi:hypothetical protein